MNEDDWRTLLTKVATIYEEEKARARAKDGTRDYTFLHQQP